MHTIASTPRPLGKIVSIQTNEEVETTLFKKIALTVDRSIIVINIDQICYFESDSNYTKVWIMDGTMILSSKTMKRFEDRVDNTLFLRVHKSFLINKDQIRGYDHADHTIIMQDGTSIPVSRSKKQIILNHLKTIMI